MGIYQTLTNYLPNFEKDSRGVWAVDRKKAFIDYSAMGRRFIDDVYSFLDTHPEYGLGNYQRILEANHIQWGTKSMQEADVAALDGTCVMALLVGAVRADRFSEGALLNFFESGAIEKWLLRLKEIDG